MTYGFSSWPQLYTVSLANIVTERRSGKHCDSQETGIHVKLEKHSIIVGGNKAHKPLFVHGISEAKLPW